MQPIRLVSLLFIVAAQWSVAIAQTDQWRDEEIGTPSVSYVLSVDGVLLASTYKGLYRWNPVSESWGPSSNSSGKVQLHRATQQPNGILTWHTAAGLSRYDVHRDVIEYRSLRYHVEANDSVVGVISYTGTNPNVVRVVWQQLETLDTLQLDTYALSWQFQGNAHACADGSLFFTAGPDFISFKYGRQPIVVRQNEAESFSIHGIHLSDTSTHLVMQSSNSVIASSDHGLTWRTIRSGRSRRYSQIHPTHDPDVFYAVEQSRVHLRLHGSITDTLSRDLLVVYPGASGEHGWLVRSASSLYLCSNVDDNFRTVHTGLPSGGVWDVHSLRGGIVARNDAGVLIKPTGESWDVLLDVGTWSVHDIVGGTSLDDMWMSYVSGFEQATYTRVDRQGNMTGHRQLSLSGSVGGVYWDTPNGDTLFCTWSNEHLYLVSADRKWRKVQHDIGDAMLVSFEGFGVVAVTNREAAYGSSGDLTQWRRTAAIPQAASVIVPLEGEQTVNGQNAVLRGNDTALVTQDHGRTWRIETFQKGEALAIGHSGTEYRSRYDSSVQGYRITARYPTRTVELPILHADSIEFSQATLRTIVVDEAENRLFALCSEWVRSISLPVISSVKDQDELLSRTSTSGRQFYDLLGRLIATDGNDTILPFGAYIVVEDGVVRCMLLP